MLEKILEAWQYIFDNHPFADSVMDVIIERPEVVTTTLFEKWYHEAERHAFV